ncbi:hypothetical protein [Neomegalonema perideroedes]|uniref:hypothetical protein n=1 Tax=Neomegalonema perideroedes TaxID=217219 RepID=UPI0012FD7E23|nr:hypothetical protein [Neomegalonema perideroedes]
MLMTRLSGKTAGESFSVLKNMLCRLPVLMRGSITFDNDTCFAKHALLRDLLDWDLFLRCLRLNANGLIRRWLFRAADLREIDETSMILSLTMP